MCGFAGFLSRPGRAAPADRRGAILRAMSRQLARRGPDDEVLIDDGTLAFAFRRLSIVDVAEGRQPIFGEDGRLFAAVNGEIYNHLELRQRLRNEHRFRSRSDAEVVVHLYEELGPELLPLLRGMFAVVVWDARERRLTLARDRLGIKPLYFARTPNGLLFASELKALLVHPDCPNELEWNDLDLSYVDEAAYYPVTPGRQPTYVKGVELLPGGRRLTADSNGAVVTETWWTLEPALERSLREPPLPAAAYVDGCAELLEGTVDSHLMGDVPVGALLSGGLDSSLLVAMAARRNRELHCFTILQQTTLVSGDAERARSLTRSLGLPFHPVSFDPGVLDALDFSLTTFEYFIWMMDGPKLDPDWLFKHELHRYAKTVAPAIKVMLVGQGADEFAGGYSRVNGIPLSWTGHLERRRRLLHEMRMRTRGVPRGLDPFLRIEPPRGDLQHEDAREALEHLQYHNLWHEDRTSSSQGIEARVPFLDHRLVEFLAAIPPALHAELFLDKAILRGVARRFLPAELAAAPKVPSWLGVDPSSTHEMMRDLARRVYRGFREAYVGGNDLLDAVAIDRLHERTAAPGPASVAPTKLLLALMAIAVFERFCQRLRHGVDVELVVPPSPLHVDPDFLGHAPDRSDPLGRVRLRADAQVVVDEARGAAYLNLPDGERAAIEFGDDGWIRRLLEQVSARPGATAAELALGIGRRVDEVTDAVVELLEAGWFELEESRP
jgi:asparagine synthase (glutamine-hydrolysing)